MDSLKKEPFPIQRLALALAFSPRMQALLAEARRLKQLFKCQLYIIHVGDPLPQQKLLLTEILSRFELDGPDVTLVWKTGNPVNEILSSCKQFEIDLLISGALEKESFLKYFLGSIARDISRHAKCSVLMLTEPALKPEPFRKIVVSAIDNPKTHSTIKMAVYLAQLEGQSEVSIVVESQLGKLAGTIEEGQLGDGKNIYKDAMVNSLKHEVESVVENFTHDKVPVSYECPQGKPGFCATNFARKTEADLLVISSPDKDLGLLDRVFPYDLEYALLNLPCNLLIVHSKTSHDQT